MVLQVYLLADKANQKGLEFSKPLFFENEQLAHRYLRQFIKSQNYEEYEQFFLLEQIAVYDSSSFVFRPEKNIVITFNGVVPKNNNDYQQEVLI